MKFIGKTTKAYLLLFIIIASFLISIHTETKVARTRRRLLNQKISKSHSSVKRNRRVKITEEKDDIEKGTKIFDFTLGMLTSLPGIDDYAEKIEEFIENSDACDKKEIIKAYYDGINKRKDAKMDSAKSTLENMEGLVKNLPWNPPKETLEIIKKLDASNPRKSCKALMEEIERQNKENKKYLEEYDGALTAAMEIKSKKLSFENFKEKLPNPHLPNFTKSKENINYLSLKHYFKKLILEHFKLKKIDELKPKLDKGEVNWEELIENTIMFLGENKDAANYNLSRIEVAKENKPDCSNLPTDKIYENNKVTILDKFAGGWSSLKYIGKCVINSLPNHGYEYLKGQLEDFLTGIGTDLLKRLLVVFGSVVINILSFFALKAFKILWWVVKAIYFVYKAIKEKDEKYKYWGKAVGAGIRIIYIAFMPTEKRRFKIKK